MKAFLVAAAGLLATHTLTIPSFADETIPFRPIAPFKGQTKCLSIYSAGNTAYWLNHCPFPITVRWSDNGKCQDWNCLDEIPANTQSTASIARFVRWCECRGTRATCDLPATGC